MTTEEQAHPVEAPVTHGWCEECDRLLEPDEFTMGLDGVLVCRACGKPIAPVDDDDVAVRAPWHFKILLVGTVGYLIYRVIWFIQWLHHH